MEKITFIKQNGNEILTRNTMVVILAPADVGQLCNNLQTNKKVRAKRGLKFHSDA